jgi:hypothetical protein
MIAFGSLFVFGVGFFCWLLFNFAVYALPCFAGVTAGLAAFHSGAGVIGGSRSAFSPAPRRFTRDNPRSPPPGRL